MGGIRVEAPEEFEDREAAVLHEVLEQRGCRAADSVG